MFGKNESKTKTTHDNLRKKVFNMFDRMRGECFFKKAA